MAFFFKSLMAFALLVLAVSSTNAQLSTNFYSKTCPKLFPTVKSTVQSAIAKEARMGASLLRLFFHDCFVSVHIYSFHINKASLFDMCVVPNIDKMDN